MIVNMREATRTSLHDVASAAGVSLATVDRVLHGRGGVRRFLMGSVAEHVVRRASRPVLTVRGR